MEWLRLLVETLGAVVIASGVVVAVVGLVRYFVALEGKSFTPIRLSFVRQRSALRKRQFHAKGAAQAFAVARCNDVPAMQVDQTLNQCQP